MIMIIPIILCKTLTVRDKCVRLRGNKRVCMYLYSRYGGYLLRFIFPVSEKSDHIIGPRREPVPFLLRTTLLTGPTLIQSSIHRTGVSKLYRLRIRSINTIQRTDDKTSSEEYQRHLASLDHIYCTNSKYISKQNRNSVISL